MLNARKWSKPIEANLRGSTISFSLKILSFLEAKPFQLNYSRIRFDVVAGELEKIRGEHLDARRAVLVRLEATARGAGLPAPVAADAPAGADPLEWRIETLAALLDAAGVEAPKATPEEIDEEVRRVEAHLEKRTKALEVFYDSVPDAFVREAFARYVRNVSGLRDEETGEDVRDGAGLLEYADEELVVFVISKLYRLSKVGEQEKNDSSSLSTSGPAAPTTDGISVVEPVSSEVGTRPETASAIDVAT